MPADWALERPPDYFVGRLRDLQSRIRAELRALQLRESQEHLSSIARVGEDDVIFGIDIGAERIVEEYFNEWGEELPVLLIMEGFPGDGGRTFPEGTPRESVRFTCIIDPIDGTRGLMYGKRSAWALSGVAPPPGDRPLSLADIVLAVQTELPTVRSHLSDVLWAACGEGVRAVTENLETGAVTPFVPRPSGATTLEYGFACLAKYFSEGKPLLAEAESRLFAGLTGREPGSMPPIFDDIYISTGGQLYELLVGHDRFIADLRPRVFAMLGMESGLACHPYDLCTELIAREGGVIVTDGDGGPLRYPLDVTTPCSWAGYANETLRRTIEPVLRDVMRDLAASRP